MNDSSDARANPDARHPRARELLPDETIWDCGDDAAPFGSDEGATAYDEFLNWREENPGANLTECFDWILQGKLQEYKDNLLDEAGIERVVAGDVSEALLQLDYPDVFTLDATIIATALAQLANEGRVDAAAKPYAAVALRRQLHPLIIAEWKHADRRQMLLESVARAIESA